MYNQGYRPPQQPGYGQSGWYAPQQPAPKAARTTAKKRSGKNGASSGSAGGPKPRKRRSFKWQLIKLLLILVLLAGAGVGGYLWKTQSEVRPYLNVFADNVSVDGIALGGLSYAQGAQLVQAQIDQKQNTWYVRLKSPAGEYKDITAQMLGISFDPTAALNDAWAIGHDVDPNDRKDIFRLRDELEAASKTPNEFSSAQQSADTSLIDNILLTLEKAAYRAPQDAALLGFDPDNADQPFSFRQEVYGQQLNTTAVREEILRLVQNLESGEVLLEPQTLLPSVTVADLQKTVELRYRAVTPIASSSTEDRTENIRIAFSKINGLSIPDGGKFSFNGIVGRRSMENGFLPALEYAYASERWGWGGGVCQASTTVYLAAIQGGMTILKREPHSMAVSYTELGMDATVSDTRGREIDFTFRNNSGGTVYLSAHVIGSPTNKRKYQCEVRIYGPSLNGRSYHLEAETVQVIPKPEEAVMREDEDGEYVTYTDQTKTVKGREGYVVEAYLITYDMGTEVERKKVSTDTYPAKADTVYVGVTPRGV